MSAARRAGPPAGRFPIRLVALDIDGTLVGEDLVLGERTRETIAAVLRAGVHVSLVTGRMTSSALVFAEQLGLRGPIVGYQGALIRAMPEPGSRRIGRLLVHRPLAAAAAREAIGWAVERGFDVHANHLERFIIQADDPKLDDYSAYLGGIAERVPDLRTAIHQPVTKVIAAGTAGRPMALLDAARRAFAGRADPTVSHPRFLEFVAPGVSKGQAVRWLARHHRISLGEVLAIGDQLNDLEMIEAVGHGVAMPTSPAALLAAARHIAGPVEAEGAADVLRDLVLGRRSSVRRRPGTGVLARIPA